MRVVVLLLRVIICQQIDECFFTLQLKVIKFLFGIPRITQNLDRCGFTALQISLVPIKKLRNFFGKCSRQIMDLNNVLIVQIVDRTTNL